MLYGGTEYSFARDPDFASVSTKKDFWITAIEAYYTKYAGIKAWHVKLVQEATTTGRVLSPTGRIFTYAPAYNKRGDLEWPITTIKNYIVQGLGADLVAIARVSLYNRLKTAQMRSKLIMTVHDSIDIDCPEDEWKIAAKMARQCVADVPMNFERLFKKPFNLALNSKVMYGMNLGNMEEYK